ncbi:pyridoxal phosphate-dependent aminotransferase [Sinirhodobacter huangdaonensis]|uniref:Aminotransferase n=1 Tax=Paenirhodobacter huangdaonensis TaxID=2501515 RepID=A0A443LXS5_9RHOB|nr:pyridoxal phosphate-dependent aminotransferase [Sinirhodobacter huangdaonensis]RWR54038.1 pyridoxal phosphate-dependent aminotransferase [Sinirhodobacter huangdaonensis]
MELAARVAHMRGTGGNGWGILYRARAMIAAGEKVVMLTIGEPDVKTDPAILAAMAQSAANGHTGYTDIPGIPALRAEIAARVTARTGVETRAENVLVTPGGQAALYTAHQVLLDPQCAGLYISPFYPTYTGTIRASGAEARAVEARAEAGFQPAKADILAASPGARTLLINSPNNPTGVIYTPETIAGIAGACTEADLWLISDEVYETQVWEGPAISPRSLPGMAERTVVLGSLSKSHAMTGSRIGWMVAPEAVIDAAHELAINTTYGVPGFIQDAALFALRRGAGFEAAVAAPFGRRRDIVRDVMADSPVVGLTHPAGAMYAMLDIRRTGLSGEEFAARLLDEEKIAVMPGESFGAPAAGHLRIALTLEDGALEAALIRLRAFAEALAG